jgi:hypothetical protein
MTNYSSSDYNGFRPNAGVDASFVWAAPPPFTQADMTGPGHEAALQKHEFRTLAEYSKATVAGPAQRHRGLRRLRERAPARRAGCDHPFSASTAPTSSISG